MRGRGAGPRVLAAAALLIGGALLVAAGCGGGGGETPKIFVFARGNDSLTLDPANATDGESVKPAMNLYEGLVEYADTDTSIEPCLATTWVTSEDGLRWTFTLREGVKFHDGAPLRVEDVVFSFERQMDPDHPAHIGEFIYWQDMFGDVAKVEKVDARRVRFTLSRPYAPFLSNLAMFTACVVSEKAFLEHGEDAYRNPVGTGPFRLVSWVRGEHMMLARFEDYWREPAGVERLVFKPVKDNTVRILQAEKGSVHAVDQPNPQDMARVRQNPELEVVQSPGMNVAYMAMNTQRAPFDSIKVRRAVAAAVDRGEIAEKLYYGAATPAKGMLPPTLWGHNPDSAPPAHDPSMAKQLLREAGFDQGLDVTLWFMDNPRPYMPSPKALAEYLKQSLALVGIRVTLQEFEWGAYLQKLQNGEHQMCLIGWTGDNGDPDNFLYVLLDKENARKGSASNYSFYTGQEVHELLVEAARTSDVERRTALYQQADEVLDREVPVLPLVHTDQLSVVRKGVTGYRLHPTGMIYFRSVRLP